MQKPFFPKEIHINSGVYDVLYFKGVVATSLALKHQPMFEPVIEGGYVICVHFSLAHLVTLSVHKTNDVYDGGLPS